MADRRRPGRGNDPPPAAPSSKAPLIAILLVSVVGVIVAGFVFLGGGKNEAAVIPAPVAPVKLEKPASASASKPKTESVLKDLPDDIRKELVKRTGAISDRVSPLEKELIEVEKGEPSDPRARSEKIDELRDKYAAIADDLLEVFEDPMFKPFRLNPIYNHHFQQYETRLGFYSDRQRQLRKMGEAATWEMKKLDQQATSKPR
jgi:hypothetical protein